VGFEGLAVSAAGDFVGQDESGAEWHGELLLF